MLSKHVMHDVIMRRQTHSESPSSAQSHVLHSLWKLSLTLAELRQAKTMDKKVYQFESVFLSDMLALTFTSP